MRRKILLTFLTLLFFAPTLRADILIQPNQKIAFLGDSITAMGVYPTGYCTLVISALKTNGIPAVLIPAGIGGHTSKDMLARVQSDVIDKKPDWMTLSCGVNDVWHGINGVDLDHYKQNITAIVDKCQAAGIHVILLTSTMIGEDQPNGNNQRLIAYNDFIRQLAKDKNCPLVDLNAAMQQAVLDAKKANPGNNGPLLTSDGVHMIFPGNVMMATAILRTMGLSDAQIAAAQNTWLDIPNGITLSPQINLTPRQYQTLQAQAKAQNISVDALLHPVLDKAVADLLKK